MSNSLYPCLWFKDQAKEAATFYTGLFKNSKPEAGTQMVVHFELGGQYIMALNGGPQFRPNPAISFYTTIEQEDELRHIWKELVTGGSVLMPLDAYDWNPLYGWAEDRYGVNWQLSLGNVQEVGQRVIPLLMFCGENQGKAEQAIAFYTEIFERSGTDMVARYETGQTKVDASVVHARFHLRDTPLMAMDSAVSQPFTFNEGISLVVPCDTQEEIDHYWSKLTENGKESMCGWCRDPFGVWWQIIPSILGSLMSDPKKAPRVVEAFLKMKKFDIDTLLRA